jgi:hypothetical protein
MHIDVNAIYKLQLWRFLTGQFVFKNMAQAIVGIMLLYFCRQFERFLGSKKYGAFVFLAFSISVMIQLGVVVIMESLDIHYASANGPYFLVFALLPLYHSYIPKLHNSEYTLLGVGFSEKSWIYVLAMQLLFSEGIHSIIPAVIGLGVGYSYGHDVLSLQQFRLPRIVEVLYHIMLTSLLAIMIVNVFICVDCLMRAFVY